MPPAAASSKPSAGADRTSSLATGGKYTWQQVAEHNNAQSAWVIVDGKVYDITAFADKHPGGKEMLMLAAGRECTELFNMYHVFNEEKARKYLAAYQIGTTVGPTEFPMYAPDKSGFYTTLKKRVVAHFARTGKDPRDPKQGLMRIIPVFAVYLFLFLAMHRVILTDLSFGVRCVLAAFLGAAQVLPLMHWLHDASHAAIGSNETWWKVIGRVTMDLFVGANVMSWHHQHILGHHVNTNIFEADPDLPVAVRGDMRRLVKRQLWAFMYKFQVVYLPILYGFLAMKVRLQDMTELIGTKMNGPVRVNWYDNVYLRVFGGKLAWLAWRFGVPLFYFGVPASEFFAFLLISDMVSGYWLAYNFQVSHVTTGVSFPNGDKKTNLIDDSWAESQVKTGLDYAHDSAITTYLAGALNFQVEHHLFPGISQYYYPEIAPIVKQTCKEFNIPFRYENTFAAALLEHFKYLKQMGDAGKAVHYD